jgi:hypothetical protein
MRFVFWFLTAFIVSCTVGTEREIPMGLNQELYAKKRGWSASGEMVGGDTSKKVSLQAVFGSPETYTIQFQLSTIDPPRGGAGPYWAPTQAQARISWSVEGNTIERIVSVSDGTSVQGVGQGVRVVVEDVSGPIGTASVLGRRYNVSVSVAPGSRGSDSLPPILLDTNVQSTTAINTTTSIPVPQDAGVKSVMVTVYSLFGAVIPSGGARVFQQYDDAAGNLTAYDPREANGGGFVPLMPGVTNIVVQNNAVADTLVWSVIFGIDG